MGCTWGTLSPPRYRLWLMATDPSGDLVLTPLHGDPRTLNDSNEMLSMLLNRGASIGANATIVCGVTLGAHCFVGAGAVVTRDVPDYALVVGVPAQVIGAVCACGVRLPDGDGALTCGACGSTYMAEAGFVRATGAGD